MQFRIENNPFISHGWGWDIRSRLGLRALSQILSSRIEFGGKKSAMGESFKRERTEERGEERLDNRWVSGAIQTTKTELPRDETRKRKTHNPPPSLPLSSVCSSVESLTWFSRNYPSIWQRCSKRLPLRRKTVEIEGRKKERKKEAPCVWG